MTFSVVGRCPETDYVGVVVTSSSPAVAARCAYAGYDGAAASQNLTDPGLGYSALRLVAEGATPEMTMQILESKHKYFEYRQVLIVGRNGQSGGYTGAKALGKHSGHATGENVAAGGNLLAVEGIPEHMANVFSTTQGHLGYRLLQALRAGLEAGGEEGPVHSAGMLVRAPMMSWNMVDLRVDWSDECPIAELEKLWELYEPQIDDYVTRAKRPDQAPKYGVPGDE